MHYLSNDETYGLFTKLSCPNLDIKCQEKLPFGNKIVNYKSKKLTDGLFKKIHNMIDILVVSIMGFDLTKSEFV
jgi:hypothetical protein